LPGQGTGMQIGGHDAVLGFGALFLSRSAKGFQRAAGSCPVLPALADAEPLLPIWKTCPQCSFGLTVAALSAGKRLR